MDKIDKAYSQKPEELYSKLDVKPDKGLTTGEALKRLKGHGPNKLAKKKDKSIWEIILDQLKSPVIYLLGAATVISFLLGDMPEGIAILVVIVVNTGIGFAMEYQARKSMQALKQMDKLKAIALRDGKEEEIDAEEIVPGDLLLIEQGDVVPADGRIVEAAELKVNESALTGESVPVDKNPDKVEDNAQLGDRHSMAFKGTMLTMGKARLLVTATGMDTEIGHITDLVQQESKDEIPLTKKLSGLTHKLIWIILALAAAFSLAGYLAGKDLYQLAQTSIAWAVAAIPEGLAIVASLSLARGMLRLARQGVVVKKLAAVETLGETNVIFTDKTGTLTKNQLTVDALVFSGKRFGLDRKKETWKLKKKAGKAYGGLYKKLLRSAVLCNNATLTKSEQKGDPLEIALLEFAQKQKLAEIGLFSGYERLDEDPFDSESKMMGVLCKNEGTYYSLVKGATNALLDICSHHYNKSGERKELTKEDKQYWKEQNEKLASEGLRTLAYAEKTDNEKPADFMKEMTFIGATGFIDPPALEVKESLEACHSAGIEVLMVTGDHPETSKTIGEKINLEPGSEIQTMTGSELANEKDAQEEFLETDVFARVDPEQKLTILNQYRESGNIVAMTGDGVNDTPALKKADIGIAMGKRGTSAAKEVADMVLENDDFPSIISAIKQGRIIFGNIRRFIIYQLSYHLSEIIVIAAISFSVFHLPLLPLQLLFINLLTDVFPALALGIGAGRANVMQKKPLARNESVLNKKEWGTISAYGAIIALFVIGAYFYSRQSLGVSLAVANNITFFSLAFAQVLNTFNMRDGDEHPFINQVTRNKWVWYALALCIGVIIGAYYTPGLKSILSFQVLSAAEWLLIGITSTLSLLTIQLLKRTGLMN